MTDACYIEIKVNCVECGRESKIVTLDNIDNGDYCCPRCNSYDFGSYDNDDD